MEQLLAIWRRMGIEYRTDCPLSEHSSFGIGGNAALAVFARERASLLGAVSALRGKGIPFWVIGNGSNVVFPDEGFGGAVIFTAGQNQIRVEGTQMCVGAGASLTAISLAARDASLSGAAFAYGIPGTLGGAVFMNAGAFGGCMADICVSSEYYDRETDTVGSFAGEVQEFGTRTSVYAGTDRYVILGARLQLASGDRAQITADMEDFMARRKSTQPLEYPSAGSVFKRPVGRFAGKLIEDCGLKGLTVGGAQVSQKHAGFIVNVGGATARDVRTLVERIRDTVLQRTGVELECEIRFLGSE
ncbi:MAG: UDP-N-acetylmuramate dehydrogenase [Clostridia bacterium]|nr:UDP-N-acetylmuramate dehydrogenase [Clostridia bacterium]